MGGWNPLGDALGALGDALGAVGDVIHGAVDTINTFANDVDEAIFGGVPIFRNLTGSVTWGIQAGADILFPQIDIPSTSPTYVNVESSVVRNTLSEGIAIARCYGKCKIGGNKLRFNDADASDLRVIVAHCQGVVKGVTRIEVNDVEWSTLTGAHTKTEYKGNWTQTADSRFSDKACAYRGIAYHAFTFAKDDNQVGYDPNVTVVMEGLLCEPLAGGADAFTRNPAVIMWDWYRRVEGYSAEELDLNAWKSLEAYCDAIPTGSSLPRYRFDFNLDSTDISRNDFKKLLFSSFCGRVVSSQGKLKPVWDSDQMPDGSGGLTAKTAVHSFTEDNIIQGSFSFWQPERPNIVRVNFLDSDKKYKRSPLEITDIRDINQNGEVLSSEDCWYITDLEIASRRCKFKYDRMKYRDYACKFSSFSSSSDVELYDLVTVTHSLAGWTNKQFIVAQKSETAPGIMTFTLEAYYGGIYGGSQVGVQTSYESDLPNPYVPVAVSGMALAEGGFIAGDGSYVPYVTLTFTKPNNPFWLRGQVWTSIDGGSTYTFYGNTTSGAGFRIDAAKANYIGRSVLYVKVLSENTNGAVQPISAVTAVSLTILGKDALPSNVTGFSVVQIGDIVLYAMNRPAQATDADFSHFELREGSTWEASSLVATFTHTKYLLSDFTAGKKTYLVKAVDTSGNKSNAAASITITVATPSTQNIYYQDDTLVRRINAGTGTQIVKDLVFDSDCGFFVDGTETMDDTPSEKMNDSATDKMWSPGYDSGNLVTEVIDIGQLVTGKIYLDLTMASESGSSYSVNYQISEDNITWTLEQVFLNGASGTFRYIKFRVTLVVDRTNYPENNIIITGMKVMIDLPTIKNSGKNVVVAEGGTAVSFTTPYIAVSSIRLKFSVAGTAARIPTWDTKTVNGFTAYIFDKDGNDVGGIIDWEAEGY